MKNNILMYISRISLFLYPFWMSRCLKRIIDKLISYRFSFSVKHIGYDINMSYPIYVKGSEYIKIGNSFTACPGFRIECYDNYNGIEYTPLIHIGNNVCFNFNCHLGAIDKIIIGDNVLVGSNVLITDHSHGVIDSNSLKISPIKRPLFSKGSVIIENNVWLGEGVAVLPGVTIGENTIVGANAVVTKSLPKNCVAGGNPAYIIKYI